MRVTMRHFVHKKELNATLQFPRERWPIPERAIGFEESGYNSIRTRLHVDMDDCIGCLQCVRACPVDCIKIETIKAPKGMDLGTTSNGTALRLLVTRFDIDMAECCYCDLCTYPCPEECIFMTGGPNAHKQTLDYEFSVRDRDGLVFQFATASDEQVAELAETVGVPNPRAVREARREAYYREEIAATVEAVDVAKAVVSPSKTATASGAPAKADLSALNAIEDRVTRSLAKKTALGATRAGRSQTEVAQAVKTALEEAGKLTDEVAEVVSQLAQAAGKQPEVGEVAGLGVAATASLAKAVADKGNGASPPASKTATATTAGAPAVKVDLSVLNGISDRTARAKAKSILNRTMRLGGSIKGAADEIRTTLSGLGKLNSEVEEILAKLER
ncbi:MAG: 4Fe-4S binding protein [Candidatus Marinimicrobia bacterium]|nr:4Fe-4S binding protein [Candidatus Neomarinimicrobiota bacterium]